MAEDIGALFAPVQRDRDIVLVDQRGTGASSPLDCPSSTDTLAALTESESRGLDRLRTCLAGYDADVRRYTTEIAMDDLDDVRAYLGYDTINVYGSSYGTRAALAYVRRYGEHVRAMVLDGVAPSDMRLPLFSARDAQAALDVLLDDCASNRECGAVFSGLGARMHRLIARLEHDPVRARATHPRTGIEEEVTVDARFVAGVLFSALYSPLTSSLVPLLVAQAERNEFESLFALALANEAAGNNLSIGMHLSVTCAEDVGRFSPQELERAIGDSVFGTYLADGLLRACEFWPRGEVSDDFFTPVITDVPTLVLSGEIDPVTPPRWGTSAVEHFQHVRHVTLPATGHGGVTTACGAELVFDFIERGTVDGLDLSCVSALRRPPFVVSPAGPDPLAHP